MLAQLLELFVADPGFLDPIEQPGEPGVDAKTGFVFAIIRVGAIEEIEGHLSVLQTESVIKLNHCQLILIGQEQPLGAAALPLFHECLVIS